jgi:hypothetical protein
LAANSSRSWSRRHPPPTRYPDAASTAVFRCWPARPAPGICC